MARPFHSFLKKTLIEQILQQKQLFSSSTHLAAKCNTRFTLSQNPCLQFRRTYLSEMRESAFEGRILRLIRNEIQYELERSPPREPVTKFGEYMVDDRPGEQWIRLKRTLGDNEEIKIEATMFDGAMPVPNSDRSKGGIEEETQLHITFIVNISKGDGDVMEIICSAWPDSIEINRLFVRKSDSSNRRPAQPYTGPEFKELDDELQESLYEFLEERGIDEEFACFLHDYVKNKDKTEFIRWMGTVKSFIEHK